MLYLVVSNGLPSPLDMRIQRPILSLCPQLQAHTAPADLESSPPRFDTAHRDSPLRQDEAHVLEVAFEKTTQELDILDVRAQDDEFMADAAAAVRQSIVAAMTLAKDKKHQHTATFSSQDLAARQRLDEATQLLAKNFPDSNYFLPPCRHRLLSRGWFMFKGI